MDYALFLISTDFTQTVNSVITIVNCDSHSSVLPDLFLASDPNIYSAVAVPPLRNSVLVDALVSTHFLLSSKGDASFY